jgi:hypothetical protein
MGQLSEVAFNESGRAPSETFQAGTLASSADRGPSNHFSTFDKEMSAGFNLRLPSVFSVTLW